MLTTSPTKAKPINFEAWQRRKQPKQKTFSESIRQVVFEPYQYGNDFLKLCKAGVFDNDPQALPTLRKKEQEYKEHLGNSSLAVMQFSTFKNARIALETRSALDKFSQQYYSYPNINLATSDISNLFDLTEQKNTSNFKKHVLQGQFDTFTRPLTALIDSIFNNATNENQIELNQVKRALEKRDIIVQEYQKNRHKQNYTSFIDDIQKAIAEGKYEGNPPNDASLIQNCKKGLYDEIFQETTNLMKSLINCYDKFYTASGSTISNKLANALTILETRTPTLLPTNNNQDQVFSQGLEELLSIGQFAGNKYDNSKLVNSCRQGIFDQNLDKYIDILKQQNKLVGRSKTNEDISRSTKISNTIQELHLRQALLTIKTAKESSLLDKDIKHALGYEGSNPDPSLLNLHAKQGYYDDNISTVKSIIQNVRDVFKNNISEESLQLHSNLNNTLLELSHRQEIRTFLNAHQYIPQAKELVADIEKLLVTGQYATEQPDYETVNIKAELGQYNMLAQTAIPFIEKLERLNISTNRRMEGAMLGRLNKTLRLKDSFHHFLIRNGNTPETKLFIECLQEALGKGNNPKMNPDPLLQNIAKGYFDSFANDAAEMIRPFKEKYLHSLHKPHHRFGEKLEIAEKMLRQKS